MTRERKTVRNAVTTPPRPRGSGCRDTATRAHAFHCGNIQQRPMRCHGGDALRMAAAVGRWAIELGRMRQPSSWAKATITTMLHSHAFTGHYSRDLGVAIRRYVGPSSGSYVCVSGFIQYSGSVTTEGSAPYRIRPTRQRG